MISPVRRSLLVILVVVCAFPGCVVFEPVGSFFGQKYRNTVAYFNAIYNARRLFNDAEQEIQTAQRQQIASPSPNNASSYVQIPGSAKAKLLSVIDKCSNVLAFDQRSDYVDDALLLIARSQFYLAEYVKSERKCSELLSQFPKSDLRGEAQLWLGMSLIEQNRSEAAKPVLTEALTESERSGDKELQARILEKLMKLSHKEKDLPAALAYAARLRTVASDEDIAAATLLAEGQLLLEEHKATEAIESLRNVEQLTDDPALQYQAGMLLASAYEEHGQLDASMNELDVLRDNFRFKDRLGFIDLERARLLRKQGKIADAISEYRRVDTTYVRSEAGTTAALELGDLYEHESGDYALARKQYDRASGLPGTSATEARMRSAVMARYFTLMDRLRGLDSTLPAARSAAPDSSVPARTAILVDSLTALSAQTTQEVGEWFLSDLGERDSAVTWILRSRTIHDHHSSSARALFILADIASTDSSGRLEHAEAYYRRLIDTFPATPYAAEARQRLRLPAPPRTVDSVDILYTVAERSFVKGSYRSAVKYFDSLMTTHPKSAAAGKSAYASGWIYEYRLNRPDSAIARYKLVTERYGGTPIAEAARKRLAAMPEPEKKDTVTAAEQRLPVPDSASDSVKVVPPIPKDGKAPPPGKRPPVKPKEDVQ